MNTPSTDYINYIPHQPDLHDPHKGAAYLEGDRREFPCGQGSGG